MKSLESFSENVIGFRTVHAIIGHRVSTLWPIFDMATTANQSGIRRAHLAFASVDTKMDGHG